MPDTDFAANDDLGVRLLQRSDGRLCVYMRRSGDMVAVITITRGLPLRHDDITVDTFLRRQYRGDRVAAKAWLMEHERRWQNQSR